MENILEVRNLRKRYRDFELKDINFSLPKGFIMGFIGPNGAGKSTTIKLIMNLIKKDGGEIKLFGLDYLRDEMEVKNKIGFVYDENFYYEELRIDEIVRIIGPLYRALDQQAFQNWMKAFQINPRQKIKELSKGMKMKFSLAIALSHHAELLIMDEPTDGLDPNQKHEVRQLINKMAANKCILISTHILEEVEAICTRTIVVARGRILTDSTPKQLKEQYKCSLEEIFRKITTTKPEKSKAAVAVA
jgi:ABC-2 type transport system ATP-binding protein